MHLARCELVQCVVTLVALLDCPGLHIVRGASQPTSVLWPLAPCVDAAEIGDEATRTVTRSSWGATRRSSTPADFFCAYLVSFILRVCHSGMCRVRRLASLRYGLEEAGRAEDLVFNVKNHRGDHVCRYHWGVLPENRPADSPIDTRHPSR